MMNNKQDILQQISSLKPATQKLGAERIGLFGSFARGEQTETSDIDFVVEFRSGMKKYKNLLDLVDLLEETLERKVDLLTWEGMASFVQREVKKDIQYVSFVD
jgi:predicted nucleotidyltransferase